MKYIRRTLEPVLLKAAKEFPVIMLTGPRQSGKTTLLKQLLSRSHRYLSCSGVGPRQLFDIKQDFA
jgi:hypothetical protein